MSKDVTVRFRCSHKESEQLKNVATNEGLSISAYILSRLFVATNEKNENVTQNKIEPIKAAKTKKISKPTEEPKQTVKTALNKPQKTKGIYSNERRQSAKNSQNRVVLKF